MPSQLSIRLKPLIVPRRQITDPACQCGSVLHSIRLLSATALVLLVLVVASALLLPVVGAGSSTIAVEPQTVNITVGSNFSVDISIRNVQWMLGFRFKITWDPTLIEYVTRTLLLQQGWSVVTETVDGVTGTYVLQAAGGMFSSDASWVTLTFHCLGPGSSTIGISPHPDSWWDNPSTTPPFDVISAGTCNQQSIPPVGGVVEPVHKLVVLRPWLAIIGLVGCLGAVVVVVRKHQS